MAKFKTKFFQIFAATIVCVLVVVGMAKATSVGTNILTDGKVGIGTSTPLEKLEVNYGNLRLNKEPAPSALTATVSSTPGNLSTLSTYYVVTFVTENGETGEGERSNVVSPGGHMVDLTNIPTGSDKVIARKIYRESMGAGVKLVTTINDNTTTNYTDNISFDSLGERVPRINTTGGLIYNNNELMFKLGDKFTAIGRNSGSANSALYNTFYGSYSGSSNSSGEFNTFLGYNTGKFNTTGGSNLGVGSYALKDNTTGGGNIALGVSALESNISGGDNVAIGSGSLSESTSTSANLGIGSNSLYYTATGSENVAIGGQAMMYNVGGSKNTTLGHYAGMGTAEPHTFNNNTYIGYYSGIDSTGDNNVFLGYKTGFNNYDGNNNVFLGNKAGYNETGSNKLYISNSDTSSSTSLVYGEFDNNKLSFNADVGIGTGTSAPEANLDINGGDTATSTVKVGSDSSDKGSCLKLRDSDGAGWTYCTTLDGSLNCSTDPCDQ